MKIEKLLIVEDEKKIADTLQLGLSEQGYKTDVAYNGNIAYNCFRSNQYSLVLLDVNLPGINGYELCTLFRNLSPHVPIIFVTSQIKLDDKIKGYEVGADDYIVKPFEFKELLLKLKVFLKRPLLDQPKEKQVLTAADLVMDVHTKEVTRKNNPIILTSKELSLLEYLLVHKNKVVSRHDIALHVWQNDFESNTNVIDVYINYLRNKVDKLHDVKLIHTFVGRGYILKDVKNHVSSS